MRPLIGITVNYTRNDSAGILTHFGGPGQSWQMLADDYPEAVYAAGGLPVMLPVLSAFDAHQSYHEYLRHLDGILFSGGGDLSPLLYGEAMTEAVGSIEPLRDSAELLLMQYVLRKTTLPLLGICRGCQLLNIALGGTLEHDIDCSKSGVHFFPQQMMSTPSHTVTTKEGSRIHALLGKTVKVNSYHHQCIRQCAPELYVTAHDEHAVPECVEMPKREAFTLGVQWHPEGMALSDPIQAKMIKAFILEAEKYKIQEDVR